MAESRVIAGGEKFDSAQQLIEILQGLLAVAPCDRREVSVNGIMSGKVFLVERQLSDASLVYDLEIQ